MKIVAQETDLINLKQPRLDIFLAYKLSSQYSRARIQQLIKQGCVLLNGETAKTSKQKIDLYDELEIILPELLECTPKPQNIALNILYEDKDLIVLNKPNDMVVHPGAGNPDNTLVNALLYHAGDSLSGIGGVKRPGLVHRLDRHTSGVMVVAKNDFAHNNLSAQFKDHGKKGCLERKYYALVWGKTKHKEKLENYLGRSNRDRTKRAIVSENKLDAKYALMEYETINNYKISSEYIASLVSCKLYTGRTHQIRVQMANIKHPLLNDEQYGKFMANKANKLPQSIQDMLALLPGQALHAYYLKFAHPRTNEIMEFVANPPKIFNQILISLQNFIN